MGCGSMALIFSYRLFESIVIAGDVDAHAVGRIHILP
jgi:hypothetical protein